MLALEPSRVATTGVAIGAPASIIRHRFGGYLRAARTGPESSIDAHHLRVPRMLHLVERWIPRGPRCGTGARSAATVSASGGGRVARPGVAPGDTGAIRTQEENA